MKDSSRETVYRCIIDSLSHPPREEAMAPLKSDLGMAVQTTKSVPADGMLYLCVIDRFCYASLDTALVYMRMQHGLATQAEQLLRAKMIGGGL